jgi:hypothetical protein
MIYVCFKTIRTWWRLRFGRYARLERTALPDGTRVRLTCKCKSFAKEHEGVWVTSWTPRRLNDVDAPDDYRLTRESDGETAYASRNVLEPVGPS